MKDRLSNGGTGSMPPFVFIFRIPLYKSGFLQYNYERTGRPHLPVKTLPAYRN